jgi:hypothetical protein
MSVSKCAPQRTIGADGPQGDLTYTSYWSYKSHSLGARQKTPHAETPIRHTRSS